MAPADVRHDLLHSPCFNISAAGMILNTYLQETGGDLMQAIGNYHSHTPFRNQGYQTKVLGAVTQIWDLPRIPRATTRR